MRYFIFIQLYLFLMTLSFFSGCRKDPPAPPIEPQEVVHSKTKSVSYARKWNYKKLFKNYDNCRSNQYCRALYRLNSYFGAGDREQNYNEFIEMLPNSSPRVQSYILFKLFPYRSREELLPKLQNLIEKSSDIGVKKLATILFILNGSQYAVSFITSKWLGFPKDLKLAVVWAIREMASSIPMEFIEKFKTDELPAIRALYLEMNIRSNTNIKSIVECVRNNTSQSGFCALSLVRFKAKVIPSHVMALISHFQNETKSRKRRLSVPTELIMALEKLQLQERIAKSKAYEFVVAILKNRKFSDKFRGAAAKYIGRIGGSDARLFLDRYRKDRRRRVGYAVRRAIYLMEKKG